MVGDGWPIHRICFSRMIRGQELLVETGAKMVHQIRLLEVLPVAIQIVQNTNREKKITHNTRIILVAVGTEHFLTEKCKKIRMEEDWAN